jgi:hypothetical protein
MDRIRVTYLQNGKKFQETFPVPIPKKQWKKFVAQLDFEQHWDVTYTWGGALELSEMMTGPTNYTPMPIEIKYSCT